MPVFFKNLRHLGLDNEELHLLAKGADDQEKLENKWRIQYANELKKIEEKIIASYLKTGKIPEDFDLEDIFMDHYFDVSKKAAKQADDRAEAKLGKKYPQPKVARSLGDLMDQWDAWRKKKKALPAQKAFANKVKKEYLKRIHEVVKKYGKDFRTGKEFDQAKVKKHIQKATSATYGRTKTIIETETTRYYNEVRKNIYDQSEDVTHYLFVCVRDAATTEWCKGRNGLVYDKGDDVTRRETPPIHWNCRSELLPLTPYNPRHKNLIDTKSKQRRNNRPKPLPVGWNT